MISKNKAYNVSTKHPKYSDVADEWKTIEHCIAGEKAVKREKDRYLPRPSGMMADVNLGIDAYKSYITRAHFPDFTAKMLSGLTGITRINPPKIVLPPKLEHLRENCDGAGTPLEVFFFQSVRNALKTGRQMVFPDIDTKTKQTKIVRYEAPDIINWGVINRVVTKRGIDFVVLREEKPDSDDPFDHTYEEQYRVLTTMKNVKELGTDKESFISIQFDKDGNPGDISIPSRSGKKLDGFPVTIIGSTDLDVDPDQIPLLGVALCALQMYMKDADLSNALFLTCNPTLVLSGISDDKKRSPIMVGSNVSLNIPDPMGKAYYTKTDASGLAEVRLAIETYLNEAKHAGSALLSGEQKGVESGEALRIKAASTTASLSSVCDTVARGLQKCLRSIAEWESTSIEDTTISVDTDYLDNMLTPEVVTNFIKLYINDAISIDTLLDSLIQGQVLAEDLDIEEEKKRIEEKIKKAFALAMAESGYEKENGEPLKKDGEEDDDEDKQTGTKDIKRKRTNTSYRTKTGFYEKKQ